MCGADEIRSVSIIAVGDELLNGRTIETNSGQVQRLLGARGVVCRRTTVVPDDRGAIALALEESEVGELVVLTGGLGSTPDDLTRDAVAAWAGIELLRDDAVSGALQRHCVDRGIKCSEELLRQAAVPFGLVPLMNPVGWAPGLIGVLRDRIVLLLPGIPAEVQGLLPEALAWLDAEGRLSDAPLRLRLRTAQRSELSLVRACEPMMAAHPQFRWSWCLSEWGVDIQVEAPSADGPDGAAVAVLESIRADLRRRLGVAVFSATGSELPAVVQRLMTQAGLTLAVAESCTAGLLGGVLTRQSNSSAFFPGGVITYADHMKTELLGVSEMLLTSHGAVSRPVAEAMADGCRRRFETDFALSITGIAGPGGATADKPVGTTWIGLAGPDGLGARRYRFAADRRRNRLAAVSAALETLRRSLQTGCDYAENEVDDTWSLP